MTRRARSWSARFLSTHLADTYSTSSESFIMVSTLPREICIVLVRWRMRWRRGSAASIRLSLIVWTWCCTGEEVDMRRSPGAVVASCFNFLTCSSLISTRKDRTGTFSRNSLMISLTSRCFSATLSLLFLASRLPSQILTYTELKGYWRLFVLVSSFIYIFFSGYVC